MIVQKQLGYNSKPVVILNTNGFYDKLVEFFETIINQKFANTESRKLYYLTQNPIDAIEYIKNYKAEVFNTKFVRTKS